MAFVAARGSEQRETATLLLALAAEKGIDPWEIRTVHDGYEVPDALLSVADKAVLGVNDSAPETGDDSGRKTPEAAPVQTPKRRGRPPKAKVEPEVEVVAEVVEQAEPESE